MADVYIVLGLLVLALAAVVASLAFRRPQSVSSALETYEKHTIAVHRVGRPTIRGILHEEYEDALVLRHAVFYPEPEYRGEIAPDPFPLEGDVLIAHSTIDFIQRIPATSPVPATADKTRPEVAA